MRPDREAYEDQDQPYQDEVHLVLPSPQQGHAFGLHQPLDVVAPFGEQIEFEFLG
jgi:hypothetical protein